MLEEVTSDTLTELGAADGAGEKISYDNINFVTDNLDSYTFSACCCSDVVGYCIPKFIHGCHSHGVGTSFLKSSYENVIG